MFWFHSFEMKVDHPREDMPIHVGRTPHLPGELRQRACDVFMTENRSELQRTIREGPRPAHDHFTFRQLWRRLGVQRFHALDHDSMQVYVEKVLAGRCRQRNPLTGCFEHRAEGNLDDLTLEDLARAVEASIICSRKPNRNAMESFGSAVLASLNAEFERLAKAPKVQGLVAVETLKNVYYSVAKAVGVGRRGARQWLGATGMF